MSLEIVPLNDYDALHGMFDMFARDLLPGEKPAATVAPSGASNNSERVITGFTGVKDTIRAFFASDFIDDNMIGAMAFEIMGEFSFTLESTVQRSLAKYKTLLASKETVFGDTTATQAAAAAAAAIASMDAGAAEIGLGPPPAYYKLTIKRGLTDDTFFNAPLNIDMLSNERIFSVLREGTDADVIALPGLVNPVPGSMPRTAQMLEAKFAIDATFRLVTVYGARNLADVYRRLGLLADRLCLGCKVPSRKNACVAGKWRCCNCESYGRGADFETGMDMWIKRGAPARHSV